MTLAGNLFSVTALELTKCNLAIVEPLGLAEHNARMRLLGIARMIVIQADFFPWIEQPYSPNQPNLSHLRQNFPSPPNPSDNDD